MAARSKQRALSGRSPRVHVHAADHPAPARVQSIGRAFAILEEVARNRDGIGLAELSKRVGLRNSITFHLVRTMVHRPRHRRARHFRPGLAVVDRYLAKRVRLVRAAAERLSAEFGYTGNGLSRIRAAE